MQPQTRQSYTNLEFRAQEFQQHTKRYFGWLTTEPLRKPSGLLLCVSDLSVHFCDRNTKLRNGCDPLKRKLRRSTKHSLNFSQGQILGAEEDSGKLPSAHFYSHGAAEGLATFFMPSLFLVVSLDHKESKLKCHIVDFQTTHSLNAWGDVSNSFSQPHTNREPQSRTEGVSPLVPPTLWSTTTSCKKFSICSPLPHY